MVGGLISTFQAWFGGHGAGSGRSFGRGIQQLNYATLRQMQQDAAVASRRWRDSLAFASAPTRGEATAIIPFVQPDLPPVRLTTRLTQAEQRLIAAAATPRTSDDRAAQSAVAAAQRAISQWRAKNPEAVSVIPVQRR